MRVLVSGAMTHLPGHLATGSAEAFRRLGHEVFVHDYLGFRDHPLWKIANRTRCRVPALASLARPWKCRSLLAAVQQFEPDLLLVINGELYTRDAIQAVGARGVRTAMWAADDPFQKGKPLLAAPAYDRVYVFDPYYLEPLRAFGVRHAAYLPMACDPDVHRPVPARDPEQRDSVCFVGTWYPVREQVLSRLTDLPLEIWGGGWPLALARPGHPLRPYYRGRAFGGEVSRIYATRRAVVNIQHPQSRLAQNMRTFEGPACGALTVTPMSEELPRLFRVGEEIVAWRTVEELRATLRHFLEHPEEARRIAEAGRRRALAEHTYAHRMARVLEEAA